MKRPLPLSQTVVIGIDILYVGGALHADAGAQVDGLMTDARFPRKSPVGGMAIGDQQHVLVDDGQ